MRTLREVDPEVSRFIELEIERQRSTLELIASENYPSSAALQVQGSPMLACKIAEGYPGRRTMSPDPYIDALENLAIDRAKQLFGAEHANIQSATASIANLAVYMAALEVGDTVLAMDLSCGGHITHGLSSHISGRLYKFVHYGVDRTTERIDYEEVRRAARDHNPKMIIAGASSYPRIMDFGRFREIADEVGAYFFVDMAHVSGLVAGGVHPNPVPYADFVSSSTHKTLRGPRGGGVILCKSKYAKKIDVAVFPGIQGAPLMSVIAARAVVLKEAMSPNFREYTERTVRNARILAEELMEDGFKLVSDGTDTHLMVLDLRDKNMTGVEAERALESAGISVNRNLVPFDTQEPRTASGIRIGTSAVTTRGMKDEEMKQIASLVSLVLNNASNAEILKRTRENVTKILEEFPLCDEEEVRVPFYRHVK